MSETRLRGNTFIALLLQAGVQELSEKPEWGERNNGITRPNLFADLLRMTQPDYNPHKSNTLSSYFSQYLSGERPTSRKYFAFNTPAYQCGLSLRIQNEYPAVLAEMDRFYRKYLRTSPVDRNLLVGGLVEAILEDDTFSGTFDIGGKWVDKAELAEETKFIIQPFLVSVWNNILLHHPDAKEGVETYMEWTTTGGYNSPREVTTSIGSERAEKIDVDDTLPEEATPNPAEEIKKGPTDEVEPEVTEAEVFEGAEPLETKTVIKNDRVYQQQAQKIYNIEHIENFYG